MIKAFGRTVYDTDNSTEIYKSTYSFFGDPTGYEETLYQTDSGNYFVYANGGSESPYPEEKITRITKAKVEDWIDAHK